MEQETERLLNLTAAQKPKLQALLFSAADVAKEGERRRRAQASPTLTVAVVLILLAGVFSFFTVIKRVSERKEYETAFRATPMLANNDLYKSGN